MARKSFDIVLPSKSSSVDFPGNCPGDYTTSLHHTIILDGEYEVCLANIIYPVSYHNLPEGRSFFEIEYHGEKIKMYCKHGYYSSVETLVEEMNSAIRFFGLHKSVAFELDNRQGCVKMTIHPEPSPIIVRFSDPSLVGLLLGFTPEREYVGPPSEEAPGENVIPDPPAENIKRPPPALYIGQPNLETIKTIYVYADLVEYSLVGSKYTPLLCHFVSSGDYGDVQERVFLNKYYKRVAVDRFKTINIGLFDNSGSRLEFHNGEVVATLRFRPVVE